VKRIATSREHHGDGWRVLEFCWADDDPPRIVGMDARLMEHGVTVMINRATSTAASWLDDADALEGH